jgi:chromosome segregation ATPase
MRSAEQDAERGFAAKAGAMQELGRRDMTIGRLERELGERDTRIGGLEDDLAQTRAELADTQAVLASERTGHAETAATLEKRVADLASLERSLEETRAALSGTGADLNTRNDELARERETVGRIEALLAERERELAESRNAAEKLRVTQVEAGTRIMVLQAKGDELADKLAVTEKRLAQSEAALRAMTGERDGERVRADAFDARAVQAEAGLAAADARASAVGVAAQQLETRLRQEQAEHAATRDIRGALDLALAAAKDDHEAVERRNREEVTTLQDAQNEREPGRDAASRASDAPGALTQARTDRAELMDEISALRRVGAREPTTRPCARRSSSWRIGS